MNEFINKRVLTNQRHQNMEDFTFFKDKPLFYTAAKRNSQNGEDGILYYIFRCIGVTNRKCIEICAGNGVECNTSNLILNHNFNGLLFDGNDRNVAIGKNFFKYKKYHNPNNFGNVLFLKEWITRGNICNLISKHNYSGNIDLLSLDMDGVDYWILKKLLDTNTINPRVIVLEYQDIIGYKLSITVPYADNFNGWTDNWHGPNYCGASLKAFINLLKNYRFVGCNEYGFNAFFVRNDEISDFLPEEKDFEKNVFHFEKCKFGMVHRWARVKDREWISV
jgi:hypothetical protein